MSPDVAWLPVRTVQVQRLVLAIYMARVAGHRHACAHIHTASAVPLPAGSSWHLDVTVRRGSIGSCVTVTAALLQEGLEARAEGRPTD